MAIISMEKLAVIGIDAAKEDLLADLMDLGVVMRFTTALPFAVRLPSGIL